jgi:phospholipase/carboxylesterase
LLLSDPRALAGAVLMRAMLPFTPENVPNLAGKPILMLSGAADPIISPDQRERLANVLRDAGADLQYEILPAGHRLIQQDLTIAADWLARH